MVKRVLEVSALVKVGNESLSGTGYRPNFRSRIVDFQSKKK